METRRKQQRSHAPRIKGYSTTNDLVERLGLPARTILKDVQEGILISYELPRYKGRKNAPKYFPDAIVKEYEVLYIPVPA